MMLTVKDILPPLPFPDVGGHSPSVKASCTVSKCLRLKPLARLDAVEIILQLRLRGKRASNVAHVDQSLQGHGSQPGVMVSAS